MEFGRGRATSHSVANSLWKRVLTYRNTDYIMNEYGQSERQFGARWHDKEPTGCNLWRPHAAQMLVRFDSNTSTILSRDLHHRETITGSKSIRPTDNKIMAIQQRLYSIKTIQSANTWAHPQPDQQVPFRGTQIPGARWLHLVRWHLFFSPAYFPFSEQCIVVHICN